MSASAEFDLLSPPSALTFSPLRWVLASLLVGIPVGLAATVVHPVLFVVAIGVCAMIALAMGAFSRGAPPNGSAGGRQAESSDSHLDGERVRDRVLSALTLRTQPMPGTLDRA